MNFALFSFVILGFDVMLFLKKSFLDYFTKYKLVFWYGTLKIFFFTFKSLIHIKFILAYDMRLENLILFEIAGSDIVYE